MTAFSTPGGLIVSGGNMFSASWVGIHGNVVGVANTITCDGEVEAAGIAITKRLRPEYRVRL